MIRVVNKEGPIHKMGAIRRLAEFYGLLKRKKGSELGLIAATVRIRTAIEDASRRRSIMVREEFLWPVGVDRPVVRVPGVGESSVQGHH